MDSDDDDDEVRGKVYVVTGGNKGIGFSVVKRLCCLMKEDDTVYLCSRSVYRGEDAVESLEKEGLRATFHQLDIDDIESIEWFAHDLQKTHGGVDVLINNAGIAYRSGVSETDNDISVEEKAEHTINVNYFGTLEMCRNLFPLLRKHGRVVNVSSQAGHMAYSRMSKSLQERFSSPNLTIDDVSSLMDEFLDVVRQQDGDGRGWPCTFYGVSKLGVTLMSFIQQKEFDRNPGKEIIVNAVCPGFCDTTLTLATGPRSPSDGADVVVYAARLLPRRPSNPRGTFLVDDEEVTLDAASLPVMVQRRKKDEKADHEFATW